MHTCTYLFAYVSMSVGKYANIQTIMHISVLKTYNNTKNTDYVHPLRLTAGSQHWERYAVNGFRQRAMTTADGHKMI